MPIYAIRRKKMPKHNIIAFHKVSICSCWTGNHGERISPTLLAKFCVDYRNVPSPGYHAHSDPCYVPETEVCGIPSYVTDMIIKCTKEVTYGYGQNSDAV